MSHGPKPRCPWRKKPKHPMDGAHKLANGFAAAVLGGLFMAYPAVDAYIAVLMNESFPIGHLFAAIAGLLAVFWLIGYFVGDRFVDWLSDNWDYMIHRHEGG